MIECARALIFFPAKPRVLVSGVHQYLEVTEVSSPLIGHHPPCIAGDAVKFACSRNERITTLDFVVEDEAKAWGCLEIDGRRAVRRIPVASSFLDGPNSHSWSPALVS